MNPTTNNISRGAGGDALQVPEGFNPLAPVTAPATAPVTAPATAPVVAPPQNKVVVSSKTAATNFNNNSSNLNNMLAGLNQNADTSDKTPTIDNTNDSFTRMLDNLSNNSSSATKALINTIQAQRATQGASTDSQYQNYKNAIQMLGIQHNDAQATPELLNAHVNQAENEHTQKIQQLNVEENKALVDAERAQGENDLKTLTEKMAYVKDLRQQKQDYLKNVADQAKASEVITNSAASQIYNDPDFNKLSPVDKNTYLLNYAKANANKGVSLGGLAQQMNALDKEKASASLDTQTKQAQLEKIRTETSKLISEAQATGSSSVSIPNEVTGKVQNVPTDVAPYVGTSANGVMYADLSAIQGTAKEKKDIVNAAQASGLKVIINKNTALDITNIKDANDKLDTIKNTFDNIGQPDWLERDLGGLGLTKLAILAQSDPRKAAAGAMESVGLDILKALSGVQGFRGNQTTINKITEHLPKITDTKDVVNTKINYVRELISDREDALVGKNKTGTSHNGITLPGDKSAGSSYQGITLPH